MISSYLRPNRLLGLLFVVSFCTASLSHAALVTDSVSANGDWATAGNWSAGVPTSTNSAIISSSHIITVDSSVPSIGYFVIGNASSSGTLDIATGGSLVASGISNNPSVVGRNSEGGVTAALNLTGGSLTIQSNGLQIGGSAGTTLSTATMNISGGIYAGGLAVGTTNSLSTGVLTITGTGGTIGSYSSSDTFAVNAFGTLDFVLNSSGRVSTLDYANNTVTLGGTLDIDVSGYTGGTETINLIDYNLISGSFVTVGLIGAGSSNYTASFNESGGVAQVVLTQTTVPEPETWVLLFMGVVGLAALVGRREASRL